MSEPTRCITPTWAPGALVIRIEVERDEARAELESLRAQRVAPVDWPARFRAAAEVAGTGFVPGGFLNLADDLEHLPPDVVEDIERALMGGESATELRAELDRLRVGNASLRETLDVAGEDIERWRAMEQRARAIHDSVRQPSINEIAEAIRSTAGLILGGAL